jgi:hypothetical protein
VIGCTCIITPFPLTNVVHVARFSPHGTNPIWIPSIFDEKYLVYLRCKHLWLVSNQFSPVDEVIEVDKHKAIIVYSKSSVHHGVWPIALE